MSDVDRDELILGCSCSAGAHVVRFAYFPWDDGGDAYVGVVLDCRESFWRRLKAAWRFLRGEVCNYGDCAEVILHKQDIPKLRAWLDRAESPRTS